MVSRTLSMYVYCFFAEKNTNTQVWTLRAYAKNKTTKNENG